MTTTTADPRHALADLEERAANGQPVSPADLRKARDAAEWAEFADRTAQVAAQRDAEAALAKQAETARQRTLTEMAAAAADLPGLRRAALTALTDLRAGLSRYATTYTSSLALLRRYGLEVDLVAEYVDLDVGREYDAVLASAVSSSPGPERLYSAAQVAAAAEPMVAVLVDAGFDATPRESVMFEAREVWRASGGPEVPDDVVWHAVGVLQQSPAAEVED